MPGALSGLPEGSPADADSPRFEGVFNVVTEAAARSNELRAPRKLPTLFFGRAPIFADHSLDKVATRLNRVAEIAHQAWERPTYLLQACALDDRVGLYSRDLMNRSAFRTRLRRLGVEFAEDPFVTFTESSRFKCRDWGEFEASFVITAGYDNNDPDLIIESTHALLAFQLTTFRMGSIGPKELRRLVAACHGVQSAAAKNPEAVMSRLSG